MSIQLLRRAVALYRSPYVSKATNRHNREAWLRSVSHLGDRWVMRGGEAKWGHGTGGKP